MMCNLKYIMEVLMVMEQSLYLCVSLHTFASFLLMPFNVQVQQFCLKRKCITARG